MKSPGRAQVLASIAGDDTDYVLAVMETGSRGFFTRSLLVHHPRRDMLTVPYPTKGRIATAPQWAVYASGVPSTACGSFWYATTRFGAFLCLPAVNLRLPDNAGCTWRDWSGAIYLDRATGRTRVAITYQHSLQMGGSERVLEVLAEMYPSADFFCMVVEPSAIRPALRGRSITASFETASLWPKSSTLSFKFLPPQPLKLWTFPHTILSLAPTAAIQWE